MRDFVEKLYVIVINFLEGSYYKSMSIGMYTDGYTFIDML